MDCGDCMKVPEQYRWTVIRALRFSIREMAKRIRDYGWSPELQSILRIEVQKQSRALIALHKV
jgi:hypothetical protein